MLATLLACALDFPSAQEALSSRLPELPGHPVDGADFQGHGEIHRAALSSASSLSGYFWSWSICVLPRSRSPSCDSVFLLVWLEALGAGHRVAVYCSDVSGAFDKVSTERLPAKLRSAIPHPKILS
eukprot:2941370-Alexandrium_andersonii.AAC.1